ncbi:MAG: hypothetical protein UT90_C0002G0060 [Parcubacteria group bacterium GW2011_GWA1_40_21]|nr:MAG: hypothetical protein UT90_C0002G0060 [Parcubacteria group bacterium GW2011_GWA1_40_21]
MKKDFDKWNNVKKITELKLDNFGIHEREIWWTSFGVNIGVETDGKNNDFERPALIIRKFNRQMVWVLPTTLQAKDERFHEKFTLEDKEYFVAITQLRTVSTKRFLRKIGMMSKEDFIKVKQRIMRFLQENENPPLSGSSRRPKP